MRQHSNTFLTSKRPDRLWGPPSLIFNGYRDSPPGIKGRGVKLTTSLHLVPCLRMGGVIPPLPKYAVMAGTRRTLLSYCIVVHHVITSRNSSSFRSTRLEDSLFSRRQPRDPNPNQITPGHNRSYLAHPMKSYYNWSLYSVAHGTLSQGICVWCLRGPKCTRPLSLD
jgi:hypothetical protein